MSPRSLVARVLRVLTPFGPRAAGYRNDALVFGNFTPVSLKAIVCPTLIVHGTADINASFPHARAAAAGIPSCETIFVKGAGHLSVWLKPQVTAGVAQFLKRHADGLETFLEPVF